MQPLSHTAEDKAQCDVKLIEADMWLDGCQFISWTTRDKAEWFLPLTCHLLSSAFSSQLLQQNGQGAESGSCTASWCATV